jgi:uncharacterized protein (TIGR02266 family)
MGIEKRTNPRMNYIVEVQFGDKDLSHRGRIADISKAGIFIDTLSPWPVGALVHFCFQLPADYSGHLVTGQGKVAWMQTQVGMGVQFTTISEDDRERIQRCFHL